MKSFTSRFLTFLKKEKTRDFFAFIVYVLFIVFTINTDMPFALEIICFIIVVCISAIASRVYLVDWLDKHCVKNYDIGKNLRQELKKIAIEIAMYIPIWLISNWLLSLILAGQPTNQTSIEESFKISPISTSILAVIIGPILEEFVFRFLPYRFIKSKTLYVIISSIIFAGMHVINDPNPFYYILFYIPDAFYYTYRYYKTTDIWVSISLHIFNNLIVTILFFLN